MDILLKLEESLKKIDCDEGDDSDAKNAISGFLPSYYEHPDLPRLKQFLEQI